MSYIYSPKDQNLINESSENISSYRIHAMKLLYDSGMSARECHLMLLHNTVLNQMITSDTRLTSVLMPVGIIVPQ